MVAPKGAGFFLPVECNVELMNSSTYRVFPCGVLCRVSFFLLFFSAFFSVFFGGKMFAVDTETILFFVH